MIQNPIICAIDTTDTAKAKALIAEVRPQVGMVKLGLEFFTAHGPQGIREVGQGAPLFLDLKFHDIPNTVAGAVRAACRLNPHILTIHAGGGEAMMKAAAQAAQECEHQPILVGVTILTSMDASDVAGVGIKSTIPEQVQRLAALAQKSGLNGIVCSPHEIELVRAECGKDFVLVVPGIRPEGAALGDQKRVLTPKEAIEKGAHYLVIGRPITESEHPSEVAKAISRDL